MRFSSRAIVAFFVMAVFLMISLQSYASTVSSKQIRVDFICDLNDGNPFWDKYISFMNESAKDLGIKLTVYKTYGNSYALKELMVSRINSTTKPNAIVFYNVKEQGSILIKIAERYKMPVFLLNSSLSAGERASMGSPRQKYKYWIGEMTPDDTGAGYLVADELLSGLSKNKQYHIIAFKGPSGYDYASDSRVNGLKLAVKKHPNVVIDQIVPAYWQTPLAQNKFKMLKSQRYKNATIAWTASDGMAIGVANACKQLGLKPGKDIKIGGVDWVDDVFPYVKRKEINVTVGGHFVEGAWVMVLLNDYFKGKDFASESTIMKTHMAPITAKNYSSYQSLLNQKNWTKINFKKFSKVYNPSVKKYNFNLSELQKATAQ